MKRTWVAVLVIVLIAALAGGCATANGIQNARAQLQKAKAAGADWSAPYEYYAAEAFLKQAEFQAGEGDLKQANAFRQESETYSAKALQMAGGGAK
jgi:hypothetical protein